MNFLNLYLKMFLKPAKGFEIILADTNKLRFALFAFLVPAAGYTLFYILAYHAGGAPSTFKPWLALPIEQYFWYDIFLTIPGYYLSWVGSAVTVYLLCRVFKGKGEFDNVLVIIAFGIGVASCSTLVHDLTDAVLSITGIIDMKRYELLLNSPTIWRKILLTLYVIYFSWFLLLFTIGVRVSQGFGYFKSLLIALFGLVVFQTILLIFIR